MLNVRSSGKIEVFISHIVSSFRFNFQVHHPAAGHPSTYKVKVKYSMTKCDIGGSEGSWFLKIVIVKLSLMFEIDL